MGKNLHNKRKISSSFFGFQNQVAKVGFIVYHCQRCPLKLNAVVFGCKPKTGQMKPELDKQYTCRSTFHANINGK